MRSIFNTLYLPEIAIIGEKKGQKSLKTKKNVSHQDGKERIFFDNQKKPKLLPPGFHLREDLLSPFFYQINNNRSGFQVIFQTVPEKLKLDHHFN